ncbi:MAG: cytochrome c biogenesis protein CcdA [Cyclobacteriaceae bacterium]
MQLKKLLLLLALLIPFTGTAQILKKATWQYHLEPKDPKAGDEAELVFDVVIEQDWYLYSTDFDLDPGPVLTTFDFEADESYELIGDIKPIGAKEKYDDIFEGDYTYFTVKAEFRQKLKILSDDFSIKGVYEYQVCSEVDGKCILEDGEFEVAGKKEETNTAEENGDTDGSADGEKSLWSVLFIGFGIGLAAMATPCIYPLIPITISIFLKQSSSRAEGIKKALIYGISIVVFFLAIGFIISAIWGATALNELSTHWLFNIILFALFILFGLSFLGLFEIQLPNSLVTSIDRQADKGGYVGIFFMAITLVVVSFSCTVPLVSSALIGALNGGQVIHGVVSMLGFSLAFAIPFTVFALFPNFLKALPKSGGWLNTMKVILGFIELAAALKFLSVADLAYHWGILDRDVFLAIWIAIFTLLGLYLLGKIRFEKDSPMPHIPVLRMIVALLTFAFVFYLIPGLWGAPLKPLSGYLPPMHTMDYKGTASAADLPEPVCETPRFGDILHAPHGIPAYYDFDQALSCAKASGKPLFIDFTGHGCVNCREMEANVWADPEVLKKLKNDFVVVALYVDDRTTLPENEWVTSAYDGKVKKTIGKKNADFQITQYENNAQPYYVILGHENLTPLVPPRAYDLSVSNFVEFLDNALKAFNDR